MMRAPLGRELGQACAELLRGSLASVASVAALLGTGCVGSDESFIVTFRDPHDVAVLERQSDGTATQTLAAHEREPTEVVVYTFPVRRLPDAYETLSRDPDGAIVLRSSDSYQFGTDLTLVDREGRMDRQDWAPEVFLNERSRQRKQAFVPFFVPIGNGIAFRGWLASAWENVREVKKRSGADPRRVGNTFGGVTALVLGTALAGVGSWLAVDSADRARTGTAALGVGLGALGLGCDAWTLYQLFGPSREEVVYVGYPPGVTHAPPR
jgi:hypothetical protein